MSTENTDKQERSADSGDCMISFVMPPAGILFGLVCLMRGQKKRAKTMLSVAAGALVVWIIAIIIGASN